MIYTVKPIAARLLKSGDAFREVLTGKHQTIEYVSGTILDVVTDIREED